jgi:DNA-binding transcriptional ArsR family regulator
MIEALAEPMRRALLERLLAGPRSVTELAEGLPVTRPAVSQHLKVLRESRLVVDRPVGNRRIYAVDPDALAILRAYFDSFWSRSLEAFQRAAQQEHAAAQPDAAAALDQHDRRSRP